MPSVRYYREQAHLLLAWALETSDPDHATQLACQAIELIKRSNQMAAAIRRPVLDQIKTRCDVNPATQPVEQVQAQLQDRDND